MPDNITSKEAICLDSCSNIFYREESSTAEESPQQSTSDFSSPEARNTEEISEKMAVCCKFEACSTAFTLCILVRMN